MTRPTFSAVRFALRRAQHRANLRRRSRRDVRAELVRPVGGEAAKGGDDPVLKLVEELMPALGVAGDQRLGDLGEGVGEQGKSDTARRCFESFSAFLHANPLQWIAVGEEVAPICDGTIAPDQDPIASLIAGWAGLASPQMGERL